MARSSEQPKWGAGSLAAAGRQGIKELRAAVFPESNIAREAEMGMYGTLTPGEVAEQKRDDPVSPEIAEGDKHSVLGERMNELHSGRGGHEPPPPEPPEPERE